jgi:RNA recognition motif-containing protein
MSYDTDEARLRTLFAEAGTVAAVELIKDRDTQRPKGFAFITMGSQVEAEKAISMFNGKEIDGRPLTVNTAKARESRPMGGGRGDRPYGDQKRHKRSGGGGYNNNRY